MESGYFIKAVGLFCVDNKGNEILFGVSVETEHPDFVPVFNGRTPSGVEYTFNIVIGNAENVIVYADPEATVTRAEFNKLKLQKMDKVNPEGEGSFSMGRKAGSEIGTCSSVCGIEGEASSVASHAGGYNTIASGVNARSYGNNTIASGANSRAEGNNTTASGSDAHADGMLTKAIGHNSHASGLCTIARRNCETVIGKYNVDYQTPEDEDENPETALLFAVGNGNGEGERSNAFEVRENGGARIAGDLQIDGGINIDGNVTVNGGAIDAATVNGHTVNANVPSNAKFTDTVYTHPTTAGYKHIPAGGSSGQFLKWLSNGTAQWANVPSTDVSGKMDKNNPTGTGYMTIGSRKSGSTVGNNSIVLGIGCEASGTKSYAEGDGTTATGNFAAHAEGRNTTAQGDCSHAEGAGSTSSGSCSHAEGKSCTASGTGAHAEGANFDNITDSSGNIIYNIASGWGAHVEGCNNISSANATHAEGCATKASNEQAHAEGLSTIASGKNSHAEGRGTTASGTESHSEGLSTISSGANAHAEGQYTIASEYSTHAGGRGCHAKGSYSFAHGDYNISNYRQVVIGGYNTELGTQTDAGNQAFIIGAGNFNSASAPTDLDPYAYRSYATLKNCFRIEYSGNVYSNGTYHSTGADYAEYIKPWADGNPDHEDRVGYLVTIKDGLLYKANQSDYIVGITSGNPSVIGNGDEEWRGRWKRDEFNRIITKEVQVDDFEEEFNNETKKVTRKKIGSHKEIQPIEVENYNANQKYTERKIRPEWDCVGMIGVLPLRDDGTCVPGGFAKCSENGIATKADNWECHKTFFVIERINDNVISVEMR